MIRFINCMRRRSDLEPGAFRKFWEAEEFDTLIERVVSLTGASRHAKRATLNVDANVVVMESRGWDEPYDGVLEYWWESAGHLLKLMDSPEFRALREEIAAYQSRFVDVSRSSAFFTEG